MTDDDKLKLARECAIAASSFPQHKAIEDGSFDRTPAVQSALAAINALDPQLVEAVGLLREARRSLSILHQYRLVVIDACGGDGDAVRSAEASFKAAYGRNSQISAFLAKQGDAA